MFLEPRVVGRALDREVERDLEPELARAHDEAVELLHRAELRIDRGVPAERRADRPRTAWVAGPRDERVVAPLAVRLADRVDRWQVDDVEAELHESRQDPLDADEAAERAGKQLVPRAEASELAVDVDAEAKAKLDFSVPVLHIQREQLLEREACAEERLTLRQLAGKIGLPAVELAPHLVVPRGDPVGPRRDGERPATARVHGERAAPLVVAEGLQRRLAPAPSTRRAETHRGSEHIVTVAKNHRTDDDLVAEGPFHGKAPAVDLRLDALDLD